MIREIFMQQAKFEIASWVFALVTVIGCGGGSSSGGGTPTAAETKDLCVKVCQKLVSCQSLPLDCTGDFCAADGPGMSAIPPDCVTRDAFNKVGACVDGACTALTSCLSSATSQCDTGTGGSSSTGGSGSTGGGTSTGGAGSGDCSVCTKAQACCVAVAAQTGQDSSTCASLSAASCMTSASQSTQISACQSILTAGAGLNIAACK